MESLARKIARHIRIGANLVVGRSASSARRHWLIYPQVASGDDVCIFVSYSPDGTVSGRVTRHVAAWAGAGFKVMLVIALANLEDRARVHAPDSVSGLMVRENVGYDFAAWASAIGDMPDLISCNAVAISNDSVLGPIGNFAGLVGRAVAADADIVGLTESTQRRVHLQSYFVIFKERAVSSAAFRSFWSSIKNGDRDFVVSRYETLMCDYFRRHGFTTTALFPTPDCAGNPTLDCWRELRDRGFPYLKAALLRSGEDFDVNEARPYLSAADGS